MIWTNGNKSNQNLNLNLLNKCPNSTATALRHWATDEVIGGFSNDSLRAAKWCQPLVGILVAIDYE